MSVKLAVIPSYVKAINKSSLKARSKVDYENAMQSELHSIKGEVVLFRTYIDSDEYWEFAFNREKGIGQIEFLYTTYGYDEE